MRETTLNYILRRTETRRFASLLVILCALCAFVGNIFAQNAEDFAFIIERGTTEQKRDALAQIRNQKSAELSRVAVRALGDKSEIVRATAAFSVIFLAPDEAVRDLSPLLNDKKDLVRREAAYALGAVGSADALSALLAVLRKDKVLEVRSAAAVALGQIGDASTVPELVRILQAKPTVKEEFLRRSAARSIGQIAQIVQTSERKAIQAPENLAAQKYNFIVEAKYADLVEAFPAFASANDALIQILRGTREAADVKREAAFALGAIGDAAAVEVLQLSLQADDYYLAEISREALRAIEFLNKTRNAKETTPNPR